MILSRAPYKKPDVSEVINIRDRLKDALRQHSEVPFLGDFRKANAALGSLNPRMDRIIDRECNHHLPANRIGNERRLALLNELISRLEGQT